MKSITGKYVVVAVAVGVASGIFLFLHARSDSCQHVDELIGEQTALALEFDLAIRQYVADEVRPRVEKMAGGDTFEPETMSTSFVARSVFEKVRKQFPDYIIKFSSANPRNPENRAEADELQILDYFTQHPKAESWSGEITIMGKPHLARFAARRVEPGCLRCHGDPQDAPASLLARYGAEAGFGQQVGDVMAMDMVAIPRQRVQETINSHLAKQSVVLALGLVVLIGCMAVAFHYVAGRRLRSMARSFQAMAGASDSIHAGTLEVKGRDEIADLAASFNILAEKLRFSQARLEGMVADRTDELARANENLQREIAEKNRSQEALKQSETMFRDFVEGTDNIILQVDSRFRITYINRSAQHIYPGDPRELFGRSALDFVHPEDRVATAAALRQWTQQKVRTAEYENRLVDAAGMPRNMLWSASLHYDEHGGLVQLNLIGNDMTESKRNMTALRTSRQQLRGMIDNIRDLVWLKDTDCKYVVVNWAFAAACGMKPENIVGKTDHDLWPQELADHYHENDRSVMTSGKTLCFDEQLEARGGPRVWVETIKTPVFDDQGAVIGTAGVARDVTERRRSEGRAQALLQEQQQFTRLAVGRELRMIELKREVNAMAERAGLKAPYDLGFAATGVGEGRNS
ncbi:MAG: PAS domain-containing protein [Planctomycetes bacterium]|nr:PAS domain-containing protein [Planctomycetota bacterium]